MEGVTNVPSESREKNSHLSETTLSFWFLLKSQFLLLGIIQHFITRDNTALSLSLNFFSTELYLFFN